MITQAPSAYVAQKHNDVNYIVASAKYHQFPKKQQVEKEPVKLRTNFDVSWDYMVKTLEDLV